MTTERLEADIEARRLDGLATELTGLAQQFPFHEPVQAQLMRVLAYCGRHGDALELYRTLYARLDDELGVRPGPVLSAAHQEVLRLEDGPAEEPRPPRRQGVDPSTGGLPVPRTAPRVAAALVGRDLELETIVRAAGRSTDPLSPPEVVVVSGLGGMGKTTLAIAAAHRLREQFPDGTLYQAFDARTAEPTTESVLGLFLRLLGVPPAAVPDDYATRVATYRSVLDGRRILVVLDGVEDAEAVLDLLPTHPSAMAIVTGRTPLVECEPTARVVLHGLDGEGAVELLDRTLAAQGTHDPPSAATLARLAEESRGHPLLLRILATRLASRPELSVETALASLSAARSGDAAVDPSIDTVFAGLRIAETPLSPAARTLLHRLAVLPFQDVSLQLVEALDDGPAGEALLELRQAYLVEPAPRAGGPAAVRLHDLVRLYLRRTASRSDLTAPEHHATGGAPPKCAAQSMDLARQQDIVATAGERLLSLAAGHLRRYPARLIPAPPGLPPGPQRGVDASAADALAFFQSDYDAMLTSAATLAPRHTGLAWRLLAACGNHVHTSVEPDRWVAAAHTVRAHLSPDDADDIRGATYLDLVESLTLHEAARCQEAAMQARSTHEAMVRDEDVGGAVAAAVVLARAERANGHRDAAEAALRWAGEHCDETSDPVLTAYVGLAEGSLLDDYDELAEAQRCLRESLAVADGTDEWWVRATAQCALARVDRRLGSYAEGMRLATLSHETFERLGDRRGCTAAIDTRADLFVHMGNFTDALPVAQEAVDQAAQCHDAFLLHRAERTLGRALAGCRRWPEAESRLRDSAVGFEQLGRPLSRAATLRDLARLLDGTGRAEASLAVHLEERHLLDDAGFGPVAELDAAIARLRYVQPPPRS